MDNVELSTYCRGTLLGKTKMVLLITGLIGLKLKIALKMQSCYNLKMTKVGRDWIWYLCMVLLYIIAIKYIFIRHLFLLNNMEVHWQIQKLLPSSAPVPAPAGMSKLEFQFSNQPNPTPKFKVNGRRSQFVGKWKTT